jgi:carboxyl-terminal processing protease
MTRTKNNSTRKHAVVVLSAALLVLLGGAPAALSAEGADEAPAILESTARHRQVARMVTRFVERAHYARARVDDELSAAILDDYMRSLDPGKHYFLASDVVYFARYRSGLDDVLRSGELDAVFDIFRLYRLRAQQNLGYAIAALDQEPNFAIDEVYYFDREDLPWIETSAEMQDLWRRRVKNDALSLMLADKTWDEAAEILRKRYQRLLKRINELDSDDVFENFMNTFAHTLDPHSSYLSPRQSEEYRIQMSLSYQGIGASLRLEEDLVTVLNVIPGGPAAIDGRIQAEDRIVAVGQEDSDELTDVVGWQLDDVVQLIRGPSGTAVRLQILPASGMAGDETIVELVRDKIKLEEQAASKEVMELQRDGRLMRMGVIKVPSFYQDFDARNRGDKDYVSTTRDVERLIGELEAEGIEGLILDLRGNGGGHLSEATALTGLFIDKGPVVQLRDMNGRIEVLDDPIPSVAYKGPLVVMVDRFSASASEIFAAAIQDYQRGVVIGQQTFGKGTVQNLYLLDQYARRVPDDGLGQLTLTIGKYYRVTGGSTQHRGVLPDIELPSAVDPSEIGESSRDRALPWDQIDSTRFRVSDDVGLQIDSLNRTQRTRLSSDPDVRYLLDDIEALEEVRGKRYVSLNIETRKSERETRKAEQLARENARRSARGLEPIASMDDLPEDERTDVLRDQAAEVLGDMVGQLRNAPVLTQTAES